MKIEIIADGHSVLRTKQVSAKHRVSSFCKRNQKGSPLINNIYIYKLCILLLFLFSPKGGGTATTVTFPRVFGKSAEGFSRYTSKTGQLIAF